MNTAGSCRNYAETMGPDFNSGGNFFVQGDAAVQPVAAAFGGAPAATAEIHAQLLSAKEEVASLQAQLSTTEVANVELEKSLKEREEVVSILQADATKLGEEIQNIKLSEANKAEAESTLTAQVCELQAENSRLHALLQAPSPQMFDISSRDLDCESEAATTQTFDISSSDGPEGQETPRAPQANFIEGGQALRDAILKLLKEVDQSVQERTEALSAEAKEALNQAQQKHREEVKDLRVYKVLYESRDEPVQINGNALNFAVAWNKTSLQGGTLRG
ncbi:unnamed protein product [Cladocopium goreaui]|nr:unnamed protein product [Cladocopium goreaui]